MSAILIYAIKSAILLTLLFLPGIFLMFKEKMFRFNRRCSRRKCSVSTG